MVWQCAHGVTGVLAQVVERRRTRQPLAISHHRHQQRRSARHIVQRGQHVARHPAITVKAAVNLLAARPGGLALGAFAARNARILLQLVDAVQVGLVGRGVHARANAKAIYRCAGRKQLGHAVLIEIAARQDGDAGQAALVQDSAHTACVVGKVSAVDPHALNVDTVARQLVGQRDQAAGRRLGIEGVDQHRCRPGMGTGEILERVGFAVMGLHKSMGHGAKQRNTPFQAGQHSRAAVQTGEVAGARRQQTGLSAVGAAQPEVDQQFVWRGQPQPCRLGRHHRLELQQIDDACLDQLRLGQRCRDAQ